MKNKKTYEEFIKYMWEIYPNSKLQRDAMLKAWNFLSGQVDTELKQREKIKKEINEKYESNT